MLRRLRWVAPLAIAAVGLAACSSGSSSDDETTSEVSTKADEALAEVRRAMSARAIAPAARTVVRTAASAGVPSTGPLRCMATASTLDD